MAGPGAMTARPRGDARHVVQGKGPVGPAIREAWIGQDRGGARSVFLRRLEHQHDASPPRRAACDHPGETRQDRRVAVVATQMALGPRRSSNVRRPDRSSMGRASSSARNMTVGPARAALPDRGDAVAAKPGDKMRRAERPQRARNLGRRPGLLPRQFGVAVQAVAKLPSSFSVSSTMSAIGQHLFTTLARRSRHFGTAGPADDPPRTFAPLVFFFFLIVQLACNHESDDRNATKKRGWRAMMRCFPAERSAAAAGASDTHGHRCRVACARTARGRTGAVRCGAVRESGVPRRCPVNNLACQGPQALVLCTAQAAR